MPSDPTERRLLEPNALAQLGRLTLESRHAMQGTVSGRHKSPHRGSSLEFAEYREYMPGDDLRRLDWRAYGRSDRFYVKEFEADTNLRLRLVVDASGSMRFGAPDLPGAGDGPWSKYEHAARLAAMLAFVAIRQGDAAGLTIASAAGDREVPSKRRPSHLSTLQDALEETEPSGPTNLVAALHAVAERTRQRALVVVLSDLFCPPEELGEALQHLRHRKHDVVAFHLLERRELEFAFDRTTRFVDLEGGAPVVAEPATMGRLYRDALAQYVEELGEVVRRANVDYHRALLDEPPQELLGRFLLARMQSKRRR